MAQSLFFQCTIKARLSGLSSLSGHLENALEQLFLCRHASIVSIYSLKMLVYIVC